MVNFVQFSWFGCHLDNVLVNGTRIRFPNIDDYLDTGEKIDIKDMIERFAEDKGLTLMSGVKNLTNKQVEQLAERIGPYWDGIYDLLGVD